jgi:hypothetical protein
MKSRPAAQPPIHAVTRTIRPASEQPKRLGPNSLDGAEYKTKLWRAFIAKDISVEDTLNIEYWAHHANKIEVGQKIEAVWEDNSKYAEYFVLSVGASWAKMALLRSVDFSSKDVPISHNTPETKQSDYRIEFNGPYNLWSIFRVSDNERIHNGCQTEEEANLWVKEHQKAVK